MQPHDTLVLGAEPSADGKEIDLKEMVLSAKSPWAGRQVRDLDISRRSLIIMIKRGEQIIVPRGNDVFRAGDRVYLYTENRVPQAAKIRI